MVAADAGLMQIQLWEETVLTLTGKVKYWEEPYR